MGGLNNKLRFAKMLDEGYFSDKFGAAVLLAQVEKSDVAHVRGTIHAANPDHGQAPVDGGNL